MRPDILPRPPRRGWISLIAAIGIQTCLGGVYAWSVFVPALGTAYRLTAAQCQLVFGVTIAAFTVAMVLAGRIIRFSSVRRIAVMGVLLYAGGWGLASVFANRFGFLLIALGLIGGSGIGFGYVAALTCGIRWFPTHKGLVTGLTVAGFGSGGALLAPLLAGVLTRQTPAVAFRLLAIGYGVAAGAAALMLFSPPRVESGRSAHGRVDIRRLVKDPAMRLLACGMFCGTFPGLLIIGNLKSIGLEAGLASPVVAVSLFAVGNAAGRIGWGWLSDRWGVVTIPWSLALLGAGIALLVPAKGSPCLYSAAALLCGIGFGSCFVLYASQIATWYGVSAVEQIYPVLFLIYGVAGLIGPAIGGLLHDISGRHVPAIIISALTAAAGSILTARGKGVKPSRE